MKKIGNFLFVDQKFSDLQESKPAIISIDSIVTISAMCFNRASYTRISLMNDDSIMLDGDHNDNIIELSQLLNN